MLDHGPILCNLWGQQSCCAVFSAMFSKQRLHKRVNGTPEGAYDRLLCNLSTSWLVAGSPLLLLGGRMLLATIGNPSINQYLQILVASSVRNAATLQRFPMLCHFSAFADTCVYFCPTKAKSGDFPNLQQRRWRTAPPTTNKHRYYRNICSKKFGQWSLFKKTPCFQRRNIIIYDKFINFKCKPGPFQICVWNSVKSFRNHFCVKSHCLCCFRCILINGDIIMAASEKHWAEKIITVASRPTINCQQVQDLSTELSWCQPSPPWLKYRSNINTNTNAITNKPTNTNTYTNTKTNNQLLTLESFRFAFFQQQKNSKIDL